MRASTSRNLLNNTLGSGALAVPSAFARIGIGLGTCAVTAACYLCALSLQSLLYCASAHGTWSYEELVSVALGANGRRVTRVSVALLQFGVTVAYVNIVGDNFFVAASSGILPPGTEPTREWVMWGVTFGVFLPLAVFVKSSRRLARMVSFGLVTTAMFGVALVVLALRRSALGGDARNGEMKTKIWEPEGFLLVLPIMVFNFAAHVMVFPVLRSEEGMKSTTQIVQAANEAMLHLWLFYVVTGVCGYVAFGANVNGNVLRNFGSEHGWVGVCMQVIKFLYGFSICSGVPLIFVSLRETTPKVMRLLSVATGRYCEVVYDVIVLYACARVATSIPNIQHVIGLVGSTTCALLMFILPGLVFLQTYPSSSGIFGTRSMLRSPGTAKKSLQDFALLAQLGRGVRMSARFMVVFGVVFALQCTRTTLRSLREEKEVVAIIQRLMSAQKFVRSKVQVYDRILTAAERFRRFDEAEKTVTAISTLSKSTESAVKEAETSFMRVSHLQTESKLAREFDALNPFAKNAEEEVIEASSKLSAARESFSNVSKTLQEIRDTLNDLDVSSDSAGTAHVLSENKSSPALVHDHTMKDRFDRTYERVREAQEELTLASLDSELVSATQSVIKNRKDDDAVRVRFNFDRLSNATKGVEDTDSLIDETLETLREAKAANAEAVLQAAVEAVEQTKNADHMIEGLREHSVTKSRTADESEALVEKIVEVSSSVADNEAQLAVDELIHTGDVSEQAARKAGEILVALTSNDGGSAVSNENAVLKKFVNATMNATASSG